MSLYGPSATGLTASPQQAQDVHKAIREQLAAKNSEVAMNVRLLYGGSVKAANAAELFGMPDIDGGAHWWSFPERRRIRCNLVAPQETEKCWKQS